MSEQFDTSGVAGTRFEDELMTIANEECGEIIIECGLVIFAICKAKRFGADAVWEGNAPRRRLARELGQMTCVIEEMIEYGIIDRELFLEGHREKREKLRTWMKHHPEEPSGE